MPVHVAEFLALYGDATNEEFGVAMRLLLRSWLTSDPPLSLPADDASVERIMRLGRPVTSAEKAEILKGWQVGNDGRMHHHGMRRAYDDARNRQSQASRAGKKSAEKRKSNGRSTDVERTLNGRSTNLKPESKPESEPNPPPTPRSDPPPVPDGGRSENVHPAERFRAMREAGKTTARAILAAYPNRAAPNAAINAVADALVRLRHGSDAAWPPESPPPSDPAAWLLARVRAYAASAEAKRDGGKWVPAAAKWFGEGRYLESDEAWNRQREQAGPVQVESAESLLARLDSIK